MVSNSGLDDDSSSAPGPAADEHSFWVLAEIAPVGLFQTDVAGNCLFVNARWRELAGMSQDAARGLGWIAALHPEDRERVAAEWYAAAREGREFRCDYRFQTAEGKVAWLHGSAVALRDDAGRINGYLGTVTDITSRRQVEESLAASETQLRLVTDHVPVGIARCSRDRRFLFVNREYAERFGIQPEQIVGRSLAEVLGEGAYASIVGYIERVLAGERLEFETVVPYSQLGERVMQCAYEPERDGSGAVAGWVAVVTDVTARRQAESALRESEHRFAQFTDHLPGLAWIKDLEGRYIYANDAAVKAFRAPRSQLYGRTDADLFPSVTAAQFQRNDRLALAEGNGIQVIETLEDPDGVMRYSLVSKFTIPGPEDRPAFIGGMAIDITDRRTAELDLQRHQERLELAQRVGNIGTFDWDIETGESEWSATQEQLFGLPVGSFGGTFGDWVEMIHPEDRARTLEACERTVRQGTDLALEYRIVRPDGTERWISAHGRAVRDAEGKPLRMVGVNLDITDRKRAEVELTDAGRRKDEFLAMLAHELRNPLAPICTSLQILKVPHLAPELADQTKAVLDRQVQNLVRLVDDLLDVSRVMQGKIELRKEAVELAAVVARAVEIARPLIDNRQLDLQVDLPREPLLIDGDPVRLGQAIANLLTNAAKYTDSGGHIQLRVEHHQEVARIRISDNGIGISPDLLPRIFELFVQADHSMNRSLGGLGIGLTLVKTLVELHGGSVEAYSAGVGAGSEFTVQLPLLTGSPQATHSEAVIPLSKHSGAQRLMVVDDNRDAANSLAVLLRLHGYEVEVAYSGADALQLAESFRPRMAFLDLGMPTMDGYEVARRLRAMPMLESMLLTAVTGWGQNEDRRRTQAAGFDYHLVKPAELSGLPAILQALDRLARNDCS